VLTHYRFRSVWSLDVPGSVVFDAVVDLLNYPTWWPDVRAAREIDDDTAELTCRSTLPYALVVRMRRAEQDPAAGRLAVTLTGDLEGHLGATVRTDRDRTVLAIEQRVHVATPLLRLLSPVARPLLRANHAAMMRRGRHGLQRHLAA
jgi:hypothetical protein